MQTRQFQLAAVGAPSTQVRTWPTAAAPRAVLQVIHGMAEHGARYARLAAALAAQGIQVYAQDLPGHGQSVEAVEDLGHVADRDGWGATLAAIHGLRERIEAEHRDTPLFLLGHSMGSYLLQDYVLAHGAGLAGAIFSGSSGDLGPLRAVGLVLMRLEILWSGVRHRSALAERMSFKDFNRSFRPNRTSADWLSRDDAEVDRYVADPRCGFRCSAGLWAELLAACGTLSDPQRLEQLRRDLPVLIVGGSEDPATRGERGALDLEQLYRAAHLRDLTVRLYLGARHELLNETCRDEVTRELGHWLLARLAAPAKRQI